MVQNLTQSQKQIYDTIINSLKFKPANNMFLITGPAGSGKTYLTVTLIEQLTKMYPKIGVGATTNKALKIIFNQTDEFNTKIKFGTIHSLLGLTENVNGYGEVTFVRQKGHEFNYPIKKLKLKLCIIDEVSQLDDKVFEYLLKEIEKGLNVIFIGDKNQTPPVNALDSKPLLKDIQEQHEIKVLELTEIIRQQKNSPIINLSFGIKENLNKELFKFKDLLSEFGNVYVIKQDDFAMQLKLMNELFNCDEFTKNSDHAKLTCWTNASVNSYNQIIRTIIYDNDNLPKINRGEKLIVDAPVIDNSDGEPKILLHTNEEIEVLNFEIKENERISVLDLSNSFKYYLAEVESKMLNGDTKINFIKILHEDDEERFEKFLQRTAGMAKKQVQGSEQARRIWKLYYQYKNHFALIKYNYALTGHKVQGSTYKNTIVNYADIKKNRNIVERNRILYTTCTRPTDNLYIIQ